MTENFVRINKAAVITLIVAAALAACVPDATATLDDAPLRASRTQMVLGGALKLSAPQGYCIEPGAVLEQNDAAFALMGRCATGGSTRAPAVLTVAVDGQGSGAGLDGAGAELAAFFQSDPGRAALSRSGRTNTVTVIEAVGTNGAFLIHFTDSSPADGAPVQPESWRAVLDVRGRLVTLSVTGTLAAPLDRLAGRKLLDGFIAAMRSPNQTS